MGHGKGKLSTCNWRPECLDLLHKAYLDAWRHVASLLQNAERKSAVSSFAENWTSPEFKKFVNDLADLVDGLGIKPGSGGWKRAEGIWARIVELEERFWPEEGEEITMKVETPLP